MMIALLVVFGFSGLVTTALVGAAALGARRSVPEMNVEALMEVSPRTEVARDTAAHGGRIIPAFSH